ncbi:hypothetical protein C8J55DRAFT_520919 [Lentinula edodes]|uniref:DUF6534 domain-containing protein n=1 Tax=Lentinula lateritia TaxID=40482 RepID=A0A9W9DJ70_9AGAR|nr:hypothetical protein C8J55DRAFT_520919 [Lentinula edodes]
MPFDIVPTVGVALAGCLVAVGLSAILGFQVFLYFSIFPSDVLSYKVLVGWIWATDAVHSVLLCITIWRYLIVGFGNYDMLLTVSPAVPITIAITATTAMSVNGFYGWRIHKMSKHNWWLTGPITFLSVAQVVLSFTDAVTLMTAKTYADLAKFRFMLMSSLSVSSVTDITIAVARYYYLRSFKRQGYLPTAEIVDGIVVFTINDGVATCAVAIAAVVCCSVPENFVSLSLYALNSKFYSNSVLATLNLRNWYRHRYLLGNRPVLMMSTTANNRYKVHGEADRRSISMLPNFGCSASKSPQSINYNERRYGVKVYVERQVEYDVGNLSLVKLGAPDAPESHSGKSVELLSATEP